MAIGYEYKGYRLQKLGDQWAAAKGTGANRSRYRLGVPLAAGTQEAKAALISFVDRELAAEIKEEGTITALFHAYMDHRERDGKQVWAFQVNWNRLQPFFGHLRPGDITDALCQEYARMRFETGVPNKRGKDRISNDTVWTELNRLSSCLDWALKQRLIGSRPAVWNVLRTPPRCRIVTAGEFQALLDACEVAHVRLFAILALCTAGRSSALCELTWDRVDFSRRVVNLAAPREHDPLSKATQKGRAVVPMNDLLYAALMEARELAQSRYVVEWRGQGVLSCDKAFAAACKRAGVEGVSPHTLRHSTATWMVDAAVPVPQISRFLGHKDLKTTERYMHMRASALEGAANIISIEARRKS